MEIWLKGTNNFRFPINPSEYTVTSEHGSETVDVNALGEIDLGGKRKPSEDFVFFLLSGAERKLQSVRFTISAYMCGNNRADQEWITGEDW